jgi:hypothetical protein
MVDSIQKMLRVQTELLSKEKRTEEDMRKVEVLKAMTTTLKALQALFANETAQQKIHLRREKMKRHEGEKS